MIGNSGTAAHEDGCLCAACTSGHEGHDHGGYDLIISESIAQLGTAGAESQNSFGVQLDYITPETLPFSANFDFGVTVVDAVGGTSQAILETFQILAEAALATWGQFLGSVAGASLEVVVNVGGTDAVASAGPGTVLVTDFEDINGNGTFDGSDIAVLTAGTIVELQTGDDPNGASADIVINVNDALLNDGAFFFDTTLTQAVPPGQIDFFSVLLHEIGHGLGFLGVTDPDTGELPILEFTGGISAQAGFEYDFLIEFIGGVPHFTGANAVAAYGGPIPLEYRVGPGSDISHVLGSLASPFGSPDLTMALMNPFVIPGDRTAIGDLELAILEDIGHTITQSAGFLINGFGDEGQAVLPGGGGGGGPVGQTITGDGNPNDLTGGEGDDTITGRGANDTLDGAGGDDSIRGGLGDDSVLGGEGNDTLIGEKGADYIDGEGGNDTIFGGIGADELFGGAGDDTVEGGADNDTIDGGIGDDTVRGQAGDDSVFGGTGNDLVEGRGGNDFVDGGYGDDTLTGNQGADTLQAGLGNDRLNGGNGADLLIAGGGVDRMTGGSGADVFNLFGAERAIIVDMEFGIDTIQIFGATISTEAELLAFIDRPDVSATATGNNGNNLTIDFGVDQQLVLQGEGDLIGG